MLAPLLLIIVPGTAWVVGNLFLGLVVARQLFAHAPAPMAAVGPDQISRALAGQVFGDMLQIWYGPPLSIACLLVCIGLGWLAGLAKNARRPMTFAALVLSFVVLGFLHLRTTGTITEVGRQAVELRSAQGEDLEQRRIAFQRDHRMSEDLVKLETLVVLVAVIGALVAAVRRPRPAT